MRGARREIGKGGDTVRQILTVVLVLAALAGLILVLVGCESADNAVARRAEAEAAARRAEAEAYQQRQAADTAAAAERSAIRQAERNAAHQRALETLPYLVAIGGGILVLVLTGLVVWDLRSRPPAQPDPALLFYLDRLRLDGAKRDRELWHALAELSRRGLPSGDNGRGVVIYDNRRQ